MLNCTGDTDCKVYMRTNGLTGLSNLQVFGLPASIYNCTGAGYSTANNLSQLLEHFEVLRCSNSTAAGYKDLGILDVYYVSYVLNNVKNL